MPPYVTFYTSNISRVRQLVPGRVEYLWGSLRTDVAPTRMQISSVLLTSPTAQVTGTVVEGNIPLTKQLVNITGAVPAYFNVSGVAISAVSAAAVPDVGVYTVSFPLTNANIPSTPSPGLLIAQQVESPENLFANASMAVSLQPNVNPAQGRSVRADVEFPTANGSVTVKLQSADSLDGVWQDLATVATLTGGVLAGGSVIVTGVTAGFLRFNNTGLAGTSGTTIVAKILI